MASPALRNVASQCRKVCYTSRLHSHTPYLYHNYYNIIPENANFLQQIMCIGRNYMVRII
jgi:hypothetical protein